MAISPVSSSIFTFNTDEVDDFARRVRSALQQGSEGGAPNGRPQARLTSLRTIDDTPIYPLLRGVATTAPACIVVKARLQTSGSREKYFVVLNIYKKRLQPKALHFDGRGDQDEQEEWDCLTADEVVARLK